jgi:hypothetical protein
MVNGGAKNTGKQILQESFNGLSALMNGSK